MSDKTDKILQLYPPWQALFEERFTKGSKSERWLWRAIHNDDDLGFILRVHLLFESGLIAALTRRGQKVKDATFSEKLTAAANAGLVSIPMMETIAAINKLRNRYAHRMDYSLTQDDVEQIFQLAVVSANVDETFQDARSRLRSTIPFIWDAFRMEVDSDSLFEEIDGDAE